MKGRKLAVLDTHFPWLISGFRYHEAVELQRLRPETAFFSLFELTDPFPAAVHPLSLFPYTAAAWGVTDAYFTFLNLAVSLLGLHDHPGARDVQGVISGISLARTFDALGIRTHVMLYPGGGLLPSTSPDLLRAIAQRVDTVFTNVDEVEDVLPAARHVPTLTATNFYTPRPRTEGRALRIVFVGDDRRRKGLDTVIGAFNSLRDGFHLDIVGPHGHRVGGLTNPSYRLHGWLEPEALRAVYSESDVLVSPATVEREDPICLGMIDGFPTTAAAEAMATGCALVASNPRRDHRLLEPGLDYVEVPPEDPAALADALRRFDRDRGHLRAIAAAGCNAVHSRPIAQVVHEKLRAMGIEP